MKILVAGDSWTWGWNVDHRWWHNLEDTQEPEKITKNAIYYGDITCVANCGDSNSVIDQEVHKICREEHFDLIIVGWTSMLRVHDTRGAIAVHYNEITDENREEMEKLYEFFRKTPIDSLQKKMYEHIQSVESIPTKVLHFSIFGDDLGNVEHKMDISFLEYLANDNGYEFIHSIPTFEFGMLLNHRYELMKSIFETKADIYPTWELAAFERDKIQLDFPKTDNFQVCGHPSEKGHKLWGKKINNAIRSL